MAVNRVRLENIAGSVDIKVTQSIGNIVTNITPGNGADFILFIGEGQGDTLSCVQDPADTNESILRVINTREKGSSLGTIVVTKNADPPVSILMSPTLPPLFEDFALLGSDQVVVEAPV